MCRNQVYGSSSQYKLTIDASVLRIHDAIVENQTALNLLEMASKLLIVPGFMILNVRTVST
jgi:hypothetical protein